MASKPALAAIAATALSALLAATGTARAHDVDGDSAPAAQPAPGAAPAAAGDARDFVAPPPKDFEGIGLTERLGARLPLDVPFRDQDGHDVVLGDFFRDEIPTILTFNYSDCPMLCSQQLGALITVLPQLDYEPGKQFRVVTIDLEPRETPRRATDTREKYIMRLPAERRDVARKGWTFLVSRSPLDDSSIRRVADAVGFQYKYIPERAEYAHPAALIFVSARAMVTRYVGGITYSPDVVRASIVRAGISEPSTSEGFVMTCFHYVPGNGAHTGVVVMQIGSAAFLVLFLSAFGMWRLVRRSRSSQPGVVRS